MAARPSDPGQLGDGDLRRRVDVGSDDAPAALANLLRLLDLNPAVKDMVEKGRLEMGHARALLALTGKTQVDAAHEVVARELTVRATERLVKKLQEGAGAEAPARKPASNGGTWLSNSSRSEMLAPA